MPVLGLIFLRCAYSRFKLAEADSEGSPGVRQTDAAGGSLRLYNNPRRY